MDNKILIVDDYEDTRLAIEENIACENREIFFAKSYKELLGQLKKQRINFVIADLKLSNRFTVLENLRSLKEKHNDTVFIIITGVSRNKIAGFDLTETSILKQGADYFLRKPINWIALNKILSLKDSDEKVIREKNRQFELLEKHCLLKKTMENMDTAVCVLDPANRLVYTNRTMREIIGNLELYQECFKCFAPEEKADCKVCKAGKGHPVPVVLKDGFYEMKCISSKKCKEVNNYHILFFNKVNSIDDTLITSVSANYIKSKLVILLSRIIASRFSHVCLYLITPCEQKYVCLAAQGVNTDMITGISGQIKGNKYIEKTLKSQSITLHKVEPNQTLPSHVENLKLTKRISVWGEIPLRSNNNNYGFITIFRSFDEYPDIDNIEKGELEKVSEFCNIAADIIVSEKNIRRESINKMIIDEFRIIEKQPGIIDMLSALINGCIKTIKEYWKFTYGNNPRYKITGHIMWVGGTILSKIAGIGEVFNDKKFNELHLHDDEKSPCIKVIKSGKPVIINNIRYERSTGVVKDLFSFIKQKDAQGGFESRTVDFFKTVQSICCYPINSLDNETIGILSLQSTETHFFNNEVVDEIVSQFATKSAPPIMTKHVSNREVVLLDKLSHAIDQMLHIKDDESNLIKIIIQCLTNRKGIGFDRAVYFSNRNSNKCVSTDMALLTGGTEDSTTISCSHTSDKEKNEAVNKNLRGDLQSELLGKELPLNVFPKKPKRYTKNIPLLKDFPSVKERYVFRLFFKEEVFGGIMLDRYTVTTCLERDINMLEISARTFSLILRNFRTMKGEELLQSMIFHRLRTDISGPLNMIEFASKNNDMTWIDLPLVRSKMWETLNNTNDLLHYSRSKLKMHSPQKRDFNVFNSVNKIKENFSWELDKSNKTVTNRVSKSMMIRGDKTMIEHAITNLIDNALKHSVEKGTIYIDVKIKNGFIEISTNNKIKSLFKDCRLEDFFEIFKKRAESHGTGLGLYIVKLIAEAHGGYPIAEHRDKTITFGFKIPTK